MNEVIFDLKKKYIIDITTDHNLEKGKRKVLFAWEFLKTLISLKNHHLKPGQKYPCTFRKLVFSGA